MIKLVFIFATTFYEFFPALTYSLGLTPNSPKQKADGKLRLPLALVAAPQCPVMNGLKVARSAHCTA